MKVIFKYLILSFFLVVLYGCGKTEIYNPNKYDRNSANFFIDPPLVPNFVLCSQIFAKRSNINYEANLKCATIQKKAQLVDVKIFRACYFFSPISSIYSCV